MLLRTQCDDGSWYVQTRSWPFQPYFESKFPYGRDQWISAPATAWAVMRWCFRSSRRTWHGLIWLERRRFLRRSHRGPERCPTLNSCRPPLVSSTLPAKSGRYWPAHAWVATGIRNQVEFFTDVPGASCPAATVIYPPSYREQRRQPLDPLCRWAGRKNANAACGLPRQVSIALRRGTGTAPRCTDQGARSPTEPAAPAAK